jgi:hypothetical protein
LGEISIRMTLDAGYVGEYPFFIAIRFQVAALSEPDAGTLGAGNNRSPHLGIVVVDVRDAETVLSDSCCGAWTSFLQLAVLLRPIRLGVRRFSGAPEEASKGHSPFR